MASLAWATPTPLAATRIGPVPATSQGHLKAPATLAPPPSHSGSVPLAAALVTSAAAVGGSKSRRGLRTMQLSGRFVATPQETYKGWMQKARHLQDQPSAQTFYAAFMGGCYVGMAALLCLALGGNITASPTARHVIFASLFPVSLLFILQTEAQLFTGNAAVMAIGAFERKVSLKGLFRNWCLTYWGNLLGCLTLGAVAQYTGLLTGGAAGMAIQTLLTKCSSSFGQALVSGIMCNWLLCTAYWLASMARGLPGKMVGIWFTISMFVGIGFEHSITNMFLLSAGLFAGAPITGPQVVLRNLLPVTLGNALSGALIVGAGMSYAFGRLGKSSQQLAASTKQELEESALVGQ